MRAPPFKTLKERDDWLDGLAAPHTELIAPYERRHGKLPAYVLLALQGKVSAVQERLLDEAPLQPAERRALAWFFGTLDATSGPKPLALKSREGEAQECARYLLQRAIARYRRVNKRKSVPLEETMKLADEAITQAKRLCKYNRRINRDELLKRRHEPLHPRVIEHFGSIAGGFALRLQTNAPAPTKSGRAFSRTTVS